MKAPGPADEDEKRRVREADRWAARAVVILGGIVGAFSGLFFAPSRLHRSPLRLIGIDPNALSTGLVFIGIGAALGAFLAWKALPHRTGQD